jgi:hypothetical protein
MIMILILPNPPFMTKKQFDFLGAIALKTVHKTRECPGAQSYNNMHMVRHHHCGHEIYDFLLVKPMQTV